jgi:hypothetical protein
VHAEIYDTGSNGSPVKVSQFIVKAIHDKLTVTRLESHANRGMGYGV